MAFERIGLEVGVPHGVVLRCMFDGHHAVVVSGRHAEPVRTIIRCDRAIILPAVRIGAGAGVLKAQSAGESARTGQAEVEPLAEVGVSILADMQLEFSGGGGMG